MNSEDVLKFWFTDLTPEQHFMKDKNIDEMITRKFLDIHKKAALGELFSWRTTPLGRLAEIIVLDQFSRNIHRDSSKAFENDVLALVLAQEAIHAGDDLKIEPRHRHFLYMPYMHSESQEIHQMAIKLFSQDGLKQAYDFELKHKEIIDRFGRYPHRNEVLGRQSSPEEIDFLKKPGSSF